MKFRKTCLSFLNGYLLNHLKEISKNSILLNRISQLFNKGVNRLVKKCWHCKSNYIEEDEEVCVDCHIFFAEENDYNHQAEMNVQEFFNEEWFEKGVTLNTNLLKDY